MALVLSSPHHTMTKIQPSRRPEESAGWNARASRTARMNTERYDPNEETFKKGKGHKEGEAQDFGVIDHGSLTGLGDDDHSVYILVTGTRAFSGPIKPATSTDAAAPN